MGQLCRGSEGGQLLRNEYIGVWNRRDVMFGFLSFSRLSFLPSFFFSSSFNNPDSRER